ncbi:Ig-like domain-containing protein [Herbiconiux sp. P17]|uniref:Ig-like domain-containing protein n=1 Tax=Herbiconiux wuyangfengii TaxID=3342794 RepID=UPI0035B8ED1D
MNSATSSEHGRVILSPDGTFTYTPEGGFSGLDTFEYRLVGRNSAASNTVTVTLRVAVP